MNKVVIPKKHSLRNAYNYHRDGSKDNFRSVSSEVSAEEFEGGWDPVCSQDLLCSIGKPTALNHWNACPYLITRCLAVGISMKTGIECAIRLLRLWQQCSDSLNLKRDDGIWPPVFDDEAGEPRLGVLVSALSIAVTTNVEPFGTSRRGYSIELNENLERVINVAPGSSTNV